MSNEFCTLFDVNYLPRGLALYRSLARHCPEFRLRVFCMDVETKEILDRIELPGLSAIGLDELEAHDRELAEVKPTRTQVEYCWTATPSVCAFALEREPGLEAITYLDADLMFFRDPEPIWREFGDDSVLIVPHRYARQWRGLEETSGTFNVQFVTFRRDARGLEALHWWRDRCIEWCYYRVEDGKLGDQKYLDDWPERFEGVHVLENPGGGLAPWNVENYELARRNGSVLVDEYELVFYHYHSLRLYRVVGPMRALARLTGEYRYTGGAVPIVWTTAYPIAPEERALVWEPYLHEVAAALVDVRRHGGAEDAGFVPLDHRLLARDAAGRVSRGVRRRARMGAAHLKLSRPTPASDPVQGWADPVVAEQMLELAREELRDPMSVPPYRAFLEAIDYALGELELPEPARLLDFGCGVGHYSELLERQYPGRFHYTGCDFSQAMVEAARAAWPGREFVVNDLFGNTLHLGEFDLVVASALVDVTEDYERALGVLLGSSARFVLVHRQRMTDRPSHFDLADGYEGQTTYRSYINRADLERVASRHARAILDSFLVTDAIYSFMFGEVST